MFMETLQQHASLIYDFFLIKEKFEVFAAELKENSHPG